MTETPTNVTPPPDLTYGYVDGRIILAIGDRSDAGRMPDPVPADGMTVTLTPANTILKVASPTPATVIKQPIVCAVDANGYLIDGQAARGVWLVTGTYKVTYSHWRAIIPSHDIEVMTGHIEAAPLDLTTAMPPGGPVLTPSEYAELNGRLTILEAGGVTDHGALTGLGEDDHPIYLTTGRGDARYVQGNDLRLSDARTPTAHTHPVAQVSDSTATGRALVTATDAAAARGTLGLDTAATVGALPIPDPGSFYPTDTIAAALQLIGSRERYGTGSPEGVVTAPVGTYYTDTALTNGAMRWAKKTGSGNTGWKVTEGDTGLRYVSSLLLNGWAGSAYLRRVGSAVELRFDSLSAAAATAGTAMTLPSGFTLTGGVTHRGLLYTSAVTLRRVSTLTDVIIVGYAAGDTLHGTIGIALTSDAWPSTLPGTAA